MYNLDQFTEIESQIFADLANHYNVHQQNQIILLRWTLNLLNKDKSVFLKKIIAKCLCGFYYSKMSFVFLLLQYNVATLIFNILTTDLFPNKFCQVRDLILDTTELRIQCPT